MVVKNKWHKTPGSNKRQRHLYKQREAEQRKRTEPSDTVQILVAIVFIAGIAAYVLEVELYRSTLIHWLIPFSMALVPSLLLVSKVRKRLNAEGELFSFLLIGFLNFGAIGGPLCWGFMALNFYVGSSSLYQTVLPLKEIYYESNSGSSCDKPYVIVEFQGLEKRLEFPCHTEIEGYNYVQLATTKGFFGFERIHEKTLLVKGINGE